MDRARFLLAMLVLAAAMVIGPATVAFACSGVSCEITGNLNDDGASLTGEGTGNGSGADDSPAPGGSTSTSPTPILPPGCQVVDAVEYCNGEVIHLPDREPGGDAATRPVTLSDIRHFRPTSPGLASEPEGWGIVGLPVNFVADAPTQLLHGTVLGIPADVRFTPTRFHWDYGDGATAVTATAGGAWADLAVAEFSTTTTSHSYAHVGSFLVGLGVEHRVHYRLSGGPWLPIDGVLRLDAVDRRIVVADATTVLVDDDCRESTTAPGC